MIDALIAGRLHGAAQQKTSKAGKPFTTAKVRVAIDDGNSLFVGVVAFNEPAQAALMALGDGDAVSLAGTLKPTAWIDREGGARAGLDLTAAQVLTSYHVTRKRRAMQPDQAGEQRQQRGQYRRDDYAADPGESGEGIPF